jgi:hypothetical protein
MKAIDIEKLLAWAYTEELPKRDWLQAGGGEAMLFGGWSSISAAAELMAETDDGRPRLGTFYHQLSDGGPHPDALLVEEAVKALAGAEPVLHDEPGILVADMPAAVQLDAGLGLERYRCDVFSLVVRCARLRNRPDWMAEEPVRQPMRNPTSGREQWFIKVPVVGAFGKRHEEERHARLDPSSRRPPAGAYRKWVWDPGLHLIVDGRADWLIWREALERVFESVAERLSSHRVTMPPLAMLPWMEGREDYSQARRVLLSLEKGEGEALETAPRLRALGRKRTARASAVRDVA